MKPPASLRFGPNALFVTLMIPLLGLAGWLFGGAFPVLEGKLLAQTLPGWGRVALGAWMAVIFVAAVLAPAGALVIWWRRAGVRQALLPYLLVLIAQISAEATFSRVLAPNVVVLIGVVFSGYRLWQLWSARRFFSGVGGPAGTGTIAVHGLLSVGLILWAANLVFLLLVALPSVVETEAL